MNAGERWYRTGSAIAWLTAGGSGGGPAVIMYCFANMSGDAVTRGGRRLRLGAARSPAGWYASAGRYSLRERGRRQSPFSNATEAQEGWDVSDRIRARPREREQKPADGVLPQHRRHSVADSGVHLGDRGRGGDVHRLVRAPVHGPVLRRPVQPAARRARIQHPGQRVLPADDRGLPALLLRRGGGAAPARLGLRPGHRRPGAAGGRAPARAATRTATRTAVGESTPPRGR